MFPPPWNSLPGFKAQDWPRHHGETSLPELADRLIKELRIQPGDGIIGASLGGMVSERGVAHPRLPPTQSDSLPE
jgi:hypothetical protein